MNLQVKTPLVCQAFAPGTPDNPLDVLDLSIADGQIRLTIRREGKLFLDMTFDDDADGRASADAMMGDLLKGFRPPTEEEMRTVPDLSAPVEDAEPEDQYLSIQWDLNGRDPGDALDLRNTVSDFAEEILDEAGLLIDWDGASIGAGTVEVTFTVTDFEAAKTLLWERFDDVAKANGCRILNEVV